MKKRAPPSRKRMRKSLLSGRKMKRKTKRQSAPPETRETTMAGK
jgi:hypothetical protein